MSRSTERLRLAVLLAFERLSAAHPPPFGVSDEFGEWWQDLIEVDSYLAGIGQSTANFGKPHFDLPDTSELAERLLLFQRDGIEAESVLEDAAAYLTLLEKLSKAISAYRAAGG